MNNIAVDPAWQGRGLGAVLLLDLVRTALADGGPVISPSRSGWGTSRPWPCTGGSAWPRSGCGRNYYPATARMP